MPNAELVSPYWLVLAGSSAGLLTGLLAGLWFGFRIVTKDASLLARFATDAAESRQAAEEALGKLGVIREEWTEYLAQVERTRAKARAAQQRVEAKENEATPPGADELPVGADLSPRERRRLIGRQLRGIA